MQELKKMIEAQQKGHNEDPIWMIGEQLKEMAEREPSCIEILKQDLERSGMGLEGAAKALKAYADKNHGNSSCFVITPSRAETILREFYGLPKRKEEKTPVRSSTASFIDLESFM